MEYSVKTIHASISTQCRTLPTRVEHENNLNFIPLEWDSNPESSRLQSNAVPVRHKVVFKKVYVNISESMGIDQYRVTVLFDE